MRASTLSFLGALAVLATACGDDDTSGTDDAGASDAGIDGGGGDAGSTSDAGGADECIPVRATTWTLEGLDDVSIGYLARLVPQVDGDTYDLSIQFYRYGDTEYVGTFDVSTGPDSNHESCAHCVQAWHGTDRTRGFFVTEGSLEITSDPFEMRLAGSLTGARLIEVTIEGPTLMSVPVPGGRCLVVEDVEFDRTFAPEGWTCATEAYHDGETCDCRCGPIDPDCYEDLPVEGCFPGEVCVGVPNQEIIRIDGACKERCDRATGDACDVGVCSFGPNNVDVCVSELEDWDPEADIGETCAEGAGFCAIDEGGFVRGVCDIHDRNDRECKPTCDEDSDCNLAVFERCYTITAGWPPEGFCSPRYPIDWTCSGDRYEDGTYCDCECGVFDPDCYDSTRAVRGCGDGETCVDGASCEPIPANDTCAAAIPLTPGTPVTGTTLGALTQYTAATPCVTSEQQGPDVAYSIALTAGQTLTVTATPTEHNLALSLRGPGAASVCDTAASCVAGVDANERAMAETLTYTATTAGTYYVIVDSFWSGEHGEFTLNATLTP
ncbi:pre-peptidase C-terminal domain-containing protein [Sandaracinus amylolyticus]|uniref:Peptidase C-terminal archaeal/bacterial domain-containing protein n=1 Tax=Sandaracinus amylolyticus TaxID=927083 RepID=A0A0F6YG83_9BACT|nr:pre-peptidase C-terminal domain-containing protein [Sandaracinus amylolyticus]AKF03576.1 hypothetical protein DB32_000725 [Sandaracinus amylolyticus]